MIDPGLSLRSNPGLKLANAFSVQIILSFNTLHGLRPLREDAGEVLAMRVEDDEP